MSGSLLQMQFDKVMKDPTGKHGEFTVTKIGQSSPIQSWDGYPNSPDSTIDFPYQMILKYQTTTILALSKSPFYISGSDYISATLDTNRYRSYSGTVWGESFLSGALPTLYVPYQSNNNVFTSSALTTIHFAKTTVDTPTNISLTPLSISRNAIVTEMLELYLQESIAYGDTIKVSYTKGTIESNEGKLLESFSNVSVNNLEPSPASPYQQWANLPNSPVLTVDYPYQIRIHRYNGAELLLVSTAKWYIGGSYNKYFKSNAETKLYTYTTSWDAGTVKTQALSVSNGWGYNEIADGSTLEANADIYNESTLSTVYFAKTTP